jgi:hypothetical protein
MKIRILQLSRATMLAPSHFVCQAVCPALGTFGTQHTPRAERRHESIQSFRYGLGERGS